MKPTRLLPLAFVLCLGSCDGDDTTDPEPNGDGSDPEASVMFHLEPPAAFTAGEAVEVHWMVDTVGTLHTTELRACMGQRDDCGDGDESSFEEKFSGDLDGMIYITNATITAAGQWTFVAFAHIGTSPHRSDPVYVTVE